MDKSEYNRHIDYCGPGESWLTRYIPNDLFGVNINHCCYKHDIGWGSDRPRYKNQDKHFRNCIRDKFHAKATQERKDSKNNARQQDRVLHWAATRTKGTAKYLGLRLAGFCISWLYYASVRLGSLHHRSKG